VPLNNPKSVIVICGKPWQTQSVNTKQTPVIGEYRYSDSE